MNAQIKTPTATGWVKQMSGSSQFEVEAGNLPKYPDMQQFTFFQHSSYTTIEDEEEFDEWVGRGRRALWQWMTENPE